MLGATIAGVLGATTLALAGTGVSTASTESADAATRASKLTKATATRVGTEERGFSPNGDGVKDGFRGAFRLDRPARVQMQIRQRGKLVAQRDLGWHGKGLSRFGWNGRDSGGDPVSPLRYRVIVVPYVGGTAGTRAEWLLIGDKKGPGGSLHLNRSTVYPYATGRPDRLQFWWTPYVDERSADPNDFWVQPLRYSIENSAGDVVASGQARTTTYHSYRSSDGEVLDFWSARKGGKPLPTGTYTLTATLQDKAGNPAERFVKKVQVSDQQLKTVTWKKTYAAAQAPEATNYLLTYDTYGGNYQPSWCAGTPSPRLSNGVRLDADCAENGDELRARFDVPFPRSVGDTLQIRAYGGPPTGKAYEGDVHTDDLWVGRESTRTGTGPDHWTSGPRLTLPARSLNAYLLTGRNVVVGWLTTYDADDDGQDVYDFGKVQAIYTGRVPVG